jgi:hypothetical protein
MSPVLDRQRLVTITVTRKLQPSRRMASVPATDRLGCVEALEASREQNDEGQTSV